MQLKQLSMKAFKFLVVLSVIIAFCSCSSKESQLVERGQRFILNQLNDPSSAKFISSTSSDKIESLLISWGVTLEEKHDAIMLEVEGSNAYGGRVRKSYCVFFVNLFLPFFLLQWMRICHVRHVCLAYNKL